MSAFSPPRSKTRYHLARGPEDYTRCLALLTSLRLDDTLELHEPVLCAWRDDKLLGFVSTKDTPFVHISMLAVEPHAGGPRSLVTLRLLEEYELILGGLGISHYYFHVAADDSRWGLRMAQEAQSGELGVREYQQVLSGTWYIRTLKG